ncbi:hypothetical protein DYB25_002157 [Aphanomyces astaci]|uniref:Uncharacterized protein n=1 Tax=Aphanomyces astaci TaxID=112090 RepID=A0A396ZNL6_APHAT|nr:hypothetical protein DYB25_002157 [Aphanomyces astaci]RHY05439.1 hypothetical protein DYB36_007965 [Aphanomyces astaci]RHY75925.1 hypothetical protein DYB34_014233 [Aphanomyces astaci]RHZ42409.1 hypothetical protein DYB26_011100 [Aphanomyces astaci]
MQLKRQHTCCQNADPHRWPTQSYCGVTLLKKAENTPTNVDSKRVAASRLDAMVHLVATRVVRGSVKPMLHDRRDLFKHMQHI